MSIQPRSNSSGGKTRESVISDIALAVQTKIPPMFELDEVAKKFPTDYNESMNTVLTQETLKYNRLLSVMKIQLANI